MKRLPNGKTVLSTTFGFLCASKYDDQVEATSILKVSFVCIGKFHWQWFLVPQGNVCAIMGTLFVFVSPKQMYWSSSLCM